MKTKLLLVISILVIIFFNPKSGYCVNLYLYNTEKGTDVLLKVQSSKGEWVQLALKEDTLKNGNVTRKIYRPVSPIDGWDNWKYDIFRNIATMKWTAPIPEAESKLLPFTKDKDFITFYLFIVYLRDQIKSGYNAVVNITDLPFELIVYDVNKMLTMPPNEDLIKHLGSFGYGMVNATGIELINKAKEGSVSVILDPQFKEPYAVSMLQFTSKIPIPKEKSHYLFIVLLGLIFIIGLLAFSFYTMSKIQKIQQDRNTIARSMSEMERQMKSRDESSVKQSKGDLIERDKYYIDATLSAMREVQQLLAERTATMQLELPVYKIQAIIESIGAKSGGKWVDASQKRLSDIVRDMLGVVLPSIHSGNRDGGTRVDNSAMDFPDPMSIDEFKQVKWSEKFTPAINRLTALAESRNVSEQASRQILEAIGRDVIATVVDAVDRESNKNADPSIEEDLKRLLAMTNIKDLDVKPGQIYNPDLHELVISNDPSLVTDREQKISKVVSRGLILPSGKVLKAKVSIQRKV